MQLKHFTLCAIALAGAAQAQPPIEQFVEARSLKDLPTAVQQALGVGDPDEAIADRGERFNPGCVVGDGMPRKRFMLGAVSADLVVVAIEQGGIAHYSSTIEWRRSGKQWVGSERKHALAFPKTMQELLQNPIQPALGAQS